MPVICKLDGNMEASSTSTVVSHLHCGSVKTSSVLTAPMSHRTYTCMKMCIMSQRDFSLIDMNKANYCPVVGYVIDSE